MAARTADQILSDWQTAAQLSDDTIDVAKGPLYALVGYPLAQVLAPTEAEVARLEQIYSAAFAQVATDAEAQAFLNNWGEAAGAGTPATVRVFFMTFTKPVAGQVISIPLGSLVGSYDQTLQFITVEAGEIDGDSATSYYNASRRSYEIGLLCQAVAVGSSYELPAGRIVTKISTIPGIDTVENREACTPGSSAETTVQQIQRVQEKFQGLAVNTGNGAYTRIKRYAPTAILDVKTILTSNRTLFKRIVYGPGADYYILGSQPATVVQNYIAVGGENSIILTSVPAISINSVTVNQVPLTNYTLVADTDLKTALSAQAQDKLVLGISLLAGDAVSISVTYNGLIQNVQTNVLGDSQLFSTSELARSFFPVPIRIAVTGRATAGYDPIVIQNNIQTVLNSLIPDDQWTETFSPQDFLNAVNQQVLGVTNVQLVTFQRSSLAQSQVEIVLMQPNEIATYDSNYVSVQIRNV